MDGLGIMTAMWDFIWTDNILDATGISDTKEKTHNP